MPVVFFFYFVRRGVEGGSGRARALSVRFPVRVDTRHAISLRTGEGVAGPSDSRSFFYFSIITKIFCERLEFCSAKFGFPIPR
jgi:hypothetical protein